MNDYSKHRPDPILPEHQLIRDALPELQLSSGLKLRVMADCHRQVRKAWWKTRIQAGLCVVAVCSLLLLISQPRTAQDSVSNDSSGSSMSTQGQGNEAAQSPGAYRSGNSDSIAEKKGVPKAQSDDDKKTPQSMTPREMQQIHNMIDELRDRERKLCGMLPLGT